MMVIVSYEMHVGHCEIITYMVVIARCTMHGGYCEVRKAWCLKYRIFS